ncbi:translation initiation factor eIF-2B subunit beta [Anthonomus grandis grandis]|uniref:translation initiation factor eIF-2B subunit beta n=1 Tax=Anthonomus grandis grandis TaxID=2921223 RepID=UPI002166BFB4|nr:translation initiation factor eIF-2B subunit beta [Anthonomus grandis grandis]XP_050312294.1 translation initiation factor eIF-2B subunit beta [Anthonomus grandis grandis]
MTADFEGLADVIKLVSDIKHKVLYGSHAIALRTEQVLEALISQGTWNSASELMELIRQRIKCISCSLPNEATVCNIMRHVLKIIREEFEVASKKKGDSRSLHHIVTGSSTDTLDYSESLLNLRAALLDHLSEYRTELETSAENIAAQASELIHSDETILTFGTSKTVKMFLKSASKKRTFNVIVVEGAPQYLGHSLAASLAKSGIQTTLIPDSAVFAMMSRVNKVIIGTHTVLANGGLRASSGIHGVALAAKHYSVPVMVLSHMYKFTPLYLGSNDQEAFNAYASPASLIPFSMGQILNKVEITNAVFDYVPPELVTLLITHQGGNSPSYVYRLLSEVYHPNDYDI